VVDATGRRRGVARRLGGCVEHGDRLVGVVAHLPEAEVRGTPRVDAAPEGWWYSTAVPVGGRVILFFTDADLPAAGRARRPGGLAALAAGVPGLTDVAPLLSQVTAYPLAAGTAWLARPRGHRWLAVGDAAVAIDPLSGQGLLMALVGGVRAAAAIVGQDATYERWLAGALVSLRLQQRAAYACEWRWPNHPFWSRRRIAVGDDVRDGDAAEPIDSALGPCDNLRCAERADSQGPRGDIAGVYRSGLVQGPTFRGALE
jgi:hypothetical protein